MTVDVRAGGPGSVPPEAVVARQADPAQVQAALRALAAWRLPGAPPLPTVGDHETGAALVAAAVDERLVGVLAVAAAAGELVLPPDLVVAAVDAHRDALTWCLRVEVELLDLLGELEPRGIHPLVLKGPAAAHLDAEDPSLRIFADLDLLVTGPDVGATVELLEARGATRAFAERRAGWDRRFAKSVTLRTPDGVEVDLHRSLCDGAHGFRIPLERLFDQQATFALGGRTVACLGPVHRLLHTAYHLALGSPEPRLGSRRDLASGLVDPRLPVDEVVAEAGRWRGEAVLAAAVADALDGLGVDAPAWRTWTEGVDLPAGEVAVVARQRREGSSIGRGKVDALAELGVRDGLAYATALLVPSARHLRSRGLRRRDLVGRR